MNYRNFEITHSSTFIRWLLILLMFSFGGLGQIIQIYNSDATYVGGINYLSYPNKNIAEAFYSGEKRNDYQLQLVMKESLEKDGWKFSKKDIKEYIEEIPYFKKDNKFDRNTYLNFLKKHSLHEKDIEEYSLMNLYWKVAKQFFNNSSYPTLLSLLKNKEYYINKEVIVDLYPITHNNEEIESKKKEIKGLLPKKVLNEMMVSSQKYYNNFSPERRSGFLIHFAEEKDAKEFKEDKKNLFKTHNTEQLKEVVGDKGEVYYFNKVKKIEKYNNKSWRLFYPTSNDVVYINEVIPSKMEINKKQDILWKTNLIKYMTIVEATHILDNKENFLKGKLGNPLRIKVKSNEINSKLKESIIVMREGEISFLNGDLPYIVHCVEVKKQRVNLNKEESLSPPSPREYAMRILSYIASEKKEK